MPTIYWSMITCILGNNICISSILHKTHCNEKPNFAPSQKSIFGSGPALLFISTNHQKSMSLSRLTPLSLHPPKHPRRCPPPDPNWFGFRNKSDSWFAFEWGPGARIYIIGLDYVGSDINRGSQRCQGDQGYFVLTDFLLLQFVHCLKWTWQIWKQGHPGDTDVASSLSRQLRELCELCELLSVTSLIISDFKEWL